MKPWETKKRAKKVAVPEHLKDAKYHAYRAKNNIKARECRAAKKREKIRKQKYLDELLQKNAQLKATVAALEKQEAEILNPQIPDLDFYGHDWNVADSLGGLYDLEAVS